MTTEVSPKPVYRMSESGKCPRALSASRLGYVAEAPPKWLEQAAEEGRWHEARIKEELKAEGKSVFDEQREVRLEYSSFILLGHIDGTIMESHRENGKLLEIKSMSQFEFDRWMKEGFSGFQEYAAQIICYMAATELKQCLYIVKNRSSGYKDIGTITSLPLFLTIGEIASKIVSVEEYVAKGELHPAEFNSSNIQCKRCEYKELCAPEPKALTPVEQIDLEAAAEKWREGKQLAAQGGELVESAKKTFEFHTKAMGIDKWRFADLAINLVQVKESVSYPKGKLLGIFTEEQLKPASIIKLPYEYLKIADLRREEVESD